MSQGELQCLELAGSGGLEVRPPTLRPIAKVVEVPVAQVMGLPNDDGLVEAAAQEVMGSRRHLGKIFLEKDRSSC